MFTFENLKKAFKKPKIALVYIWSKLAYKLGLIIPASQFGEDLILNYLIRKDKGFYVDIGANDPCFGNNTYLFYNKGWKGIAIEPNKDLYKKIKKYRPRGINLNLAVGLVGTLKYYEIDAHGMSTCDKNLADFYEKKGHKITNIYETSVQPLSEIFDKYLKGNTIDVMSVDVEGMDMQVLESNNRNKYKPHYIVLETLIYQGDDSIGIQDHERYTTYLQKYGYRVIANTYVNTIYQLQK